MTVAPTNAIATDTSSSVAGIQSIVGLIQGPLQISQTSQNSVVLRSAAATPLAYSFAASGQLTLPMSWRLLTIEGVGGGGASGKTVASSLNRISGAGAGGTYAWKLLPNNGVVKTLIITVGAAGSYPTSGSAVDGTNSVVTDQSGNVLLVATGGGTASSGSAGPSIPNSGGRPLDGAVGDIVLPGSQGASTCSSNWGTGSPASRKGLVCLGGNGGANALFTCGAVGGIAASNTITWNGTAPSGWGCGGNATPAAINTTSPGNAGTSGVVIVRIWMQTDPNTTQGQASTSPPGRLPAGGSPSSFVTTAESGYVNAYNLANVSPGLLFWTFPRLTSIPLQPIASVVSFTSGSGTFIVQQYVAMIKVVVVGGGGGGGGGSFSTQSQIGGGGGAGALAMFSMSVAPGQTFSWNVGIGGTGGTRAGNGNVPPATSGSSGSSTTFGTVTAGGGSGGQPADLTTTSPFVGAGGIGGSASGVPPSGISFSGGTGYSGISASNGGSGTNLFRGWQFGFGGDAPLGYGYGSKYYPDSVTIAPTPTGYGGGGAGGIASAAGNGASGAVFVFQFW